MISHNLFFTVWLLLLVVWQVPHNTVQRLSLLASIWVGCMNQEKNYTGLSKWIILLHLFLSSKPCTVLWAKNKLSNPLGTHIMSEKLLQRLNELNCIFKWLGHIMDTPRRKYFLILSSIWGHIINYVIKWLWNF